MNTYITGTTIRSLREGKKLTQSQLASLIGVSSKTVSKWETAKGYPDISLLEPIAKVFDISVTELISGNTVSNVNVSANMMRSKFYVCPICGNSIHSMGEAIIQCHGIMLTPCQEEESDENHPLKQAEIIGKIKSKYNVENINTEDLSIKIRIKEEIEGAKTELQEEIKRSEVPLYTDKTIEMVLEHTDKDFSHINIITIHNNNLLRLKITACGGNMCGLQNFV